MADTAPFAELFRTLASFSPPRRSLKGLPWEEYVDWAISQGLAPLAAYNLEYRMAGGGAPDWVRDRLLSVYQGSVNDNVMKLVAFKRMVDELEGRRLLLLGGAAFAEWLYPHIGFRPVLEVQVLLKRQDVEGFAGYVAREGFKPEPEGAPGAVKVMSDGHMPILLFADVLGPGLEAEEAALFARATPLKIYGKSFFRPAVEDMLLLAALEHAREGYAVPLVSYVDVRELLTGGAGVAGPRAQAPRVDVVRERARAWRLERALWSTLEVVARLFPESAEAARALQPTGLRPATRALLERAVVAPASELGRTRLTRGSDRLRRLLVGR